MLGNYIVITLCGSTRFKEEFLEVQKKLTLEGNIVISVGLFGHSGDDEVWSDGVAFVLFVVVLSLILRFVNGYTTFGKAFGYGFLLWTIVNLWDAVVLDIIWFCHDPHFVIKGTEDMVSDYHDYWFHIKGFFIGEVLALVVCLLTGLVVQYIL